MKLPRTAPVSAALVATLLTSLPGTLGAQAAAPPATAVSPNPRPVRPAGPAMPPVQMQGTPGAPMPLRPRQKSPLHQLQQGFIESNGVMIYLEMIGTAGAEPLVILHGGPGASHDYFLPYLLPLAKNHRLIFIDERGSGKSQKLQDPSGYTLDQMVEDIEGIRATLRMPKMDLLGHSFGGALAQAYALKYPQNLSHLVLASTWSSAKKMNQVLAKMKDQMSPELRKRVDAMEKKGLYGQGKPYEKNRYTNDYMIAAWGEGYFPFLYQKRPDPNYDPVANGIMSWDLYREMWGSDGEFVISGNLKNMEFTDRLAGLNVPTLLVVGDHDECDPELSRDMQAKIKDAKLVVVPQAGHMTFVDQPDMFIHTVEEFLTPPEPPAVSTATPTPGAGLARPSAVSPTPAANPR
ncbi:MAG TPA: proline iminopeptidase-family hydrolase [Thermoanaerobaculia bacterium]|nr:proline iminopeptidase-family hydrolase [Thermoanaerobaculia bacterium]